MIREPKMAAVFSAANLRQALLYQRHEYTKQALLKRIEETIEQENRYNQMILELEAEEARLKSGQDGNSWENRPEQGKFYDQFTTKKRKMAGLGR